ncbi:tetratricopeptide repeat protein [Sediminicoccus sp. BL-A-41-H5]|uniref:tetratricopeptide repeat protein n=1 Tax=Sediminicoccus sp. BL-A-41-H5 TaxID=3421106 RepID=UPI003D66F364
MSAEAAEAGVPEGQALFAYLLATGSGIPEDHTAAEHWYRKALEAADIPQAMLGLGLMRIFGMGSPADPAEGATLVAKASDAQLTAATYMLGVLHQSGTGVSADAGAAVGYYRQAAQAGHRAAQARLGLLLLEGTETVVADVLQGETWLRRAALAGDTEAAALLGDRSIRSDEGLPPNYLEAINWYRLAADGGHRMAQRALGMLLISGKGGILDTAEAIRLFSLAADAGDEHASADIGNLILGGLREGSEFAKGIVTFFDEKARNGDPVAAYNLAVCYLHGVGVAPDHEEAKKWLREAATSINNAQYWYARLISENGSEDELVEARTWYLEASNAGLVDATAALAEMLDNGRGGPSDPAFALSLYIQAAEAGHIGAMFGAGAMLQGGHGIMPDPIAARDWFYKAAAQGHPEARLMLRKLGESEMGHTSGNRTF